MYQNLPRLAIVSLKNLLLHELHDNKRVLRLKKEIPKSKILINPLIVAPIKGTKNYVVLDGANRTTCLRELGFPHIAVQVVEYFNQKQVELVKWNHLICNISKQNKLSILEMVKKTSFAKIKNRNTILITKINKDTLKSQLEFINQLYKDKEFYRVLGDDIKDFAHEYKNINFLVVYPKLKPEEIITITKNNLKVPSGITRHIIHNRAIGIDLDLKILKSNKSLSWKNGYLEKLIGKRLSEHKVRYYKEPITIFND